MPVCSGGPPKYSSMQNRVHCGVNSVPPLKIPVIPVSLNVLPFFSSYSHNDCSSLGVAKAHLTSCPAERIVSAWSMQCSL